MKICMVAPIPPPYGGIGNWTLLTSEYSKKNTDVEFIHVNIAPKKQELETKSLFKRIAVKGFAMLGQRRLLKKAIESEGIDAIHVTTSGQLAIVRDLFLLRLAKRKKIPVIYHIHFGRIPQMSKQNTREWRALRRAMQMSAHVIVIDSESFEAIRKFAPEIKVSYVPNPLDLQALDAIREKSPSARKEIAFLGWVVRSKGVDLLLSAWERLHVRYPDWSLRIIGPYDSAYVQHLKDSHAFENVIFDGEQTHDNAMMRLSGARIFALPSDTEGFPYAVLEAMGMKKAIVATKVGAIPEMLEGDCGIVIPTRNLQALEHALETLLQDSQLASKLGERAYARASEQYSVEKIFEDYRKIWSEASKSL